MCSISVLSIITDKVVQAARNCLGDRLEKVLLYGSYARGDYDSESDIDIMILADISIEERWLTYLEITNHTGDLSLEHEVFVSLHVADCSTFYEYADDLPYYSNIIREGIDLSA